MSHPLRSASSTYILAVTATGSVCVFCVFLALAWLGVAELPVFGAVLFAVLFATVVLMNVLTGYAYLASIEHTAKVFNDEDESRFDR